MRAEGINRGKKAQFQLTRLVHDLRLCQMGDSGPMSKNLGTDNFLNDNCKIVQSVLDILNGVHDKQIALPVAIEAVSGYLRQIDAVPEMQRALVPLRSVCSGALSMLQKKLS